jgi:hypothetical protein
MKVQDLRCHLADDAGALRQHPSLNKCTDAWKNWEKSALLAMPKQSLPMIQASPMLMVRDAPTAAVSDESEGVEQRSCHTLCLKPPSMLGTPIAAVLVRSVLGAII